MTFCRFDKNRAIPIASSNNEDFSGLHRDYFHLYLLTGGQGVFLLNGERCYLRENSLICLNRNDRLELLAAWQLQVISVSFAPEFMNVNLNWAVILDAAYPILAARFNYPLFNLFFKRNLLFNGILPLEPELSRVVENIIAEINYQLRFQPDGMWSCRSRTGLFDLFEIADYFCEEFMQGNSRQSNLEETVLQYIHLNLCTPLTLSEICEKYHTNHTTLNRYFKRLTGCTVTDYILQKRIHLAKHALAFTELSVTEIAEKYAFYDSTYFIKTFKKRTGVTPIKFRKEACAARPKKRL